MSTGTMQLAERVLVLATALQRELDGTAHRGAADRIVERLSGPLRVAIAGRVKAGKSTLLNALVGERLAPTDAGECTRLVSWYRHGPSYEVAAQLRSGVRRNLPFTRADGELAIELGGVAERDVASLDIRWPSAALQDVTLIDTPGLASVNDENSRRTRDFLEHDEAAPTDADAVIYLMRHLHRSDVAFLDAFMDRSVTAASPVNAVAVLSRADEIGAGRPDAMVSSRRIADRYRNDPAVTRLVADVVPVTGLLAETGLTLVESEAAALRILASTPDDVLDRMLLSADELCDLHASDLTVDLRRQLLGRLGMFGIRVAIHEIRQGATTAAQLGPRLVEHSGLADLRRVIAEHFLPRARVLQARSAIAAVRSLSRTVARDEPHLAARIDRDAEQLEAGAVEFGQIRAAHLVASGLVQVDERERLDLQRLLLAGPTPKALGLDASVGSDTLRAAALDTVERWRARAQDPFADPRLIEVAETAARIGESLYAAAS
ncbi:MAG: dynamin family protein [Actinomycetota bacterium]